MNFFVPIETNREEIGVKEIEQKLEMSDTDFL